jgi:uncharacterized membrane protein
MNRINPITSNQGSTARINERWSNRAAKKIELSKASYKMASFERRFLSIRGPLNIIIILITRIGHLLLVFRLTIPAHNASTTFATYLVSLILSPFLNTFIRVWLLTLDQVFVQSCAVPPTKTWSSTMSGKPEEICDLDDVGCPRRG